MRCFLLILLLVFEQVQATFCIPLKLVVIDRDLHLFGLNFFGLAEKLDPLGVVICCLFLVLLCLLLMSLAKFHPSTTEILLGYRELVVGQAALLYCKVEVLPGIF